VPETPIAATPTLENAAAEETSTADPSLAPTAQATATRGILHNYVLCPQEMPVISDGAEIVGYSAVCRIPIVSYRFGEGETPLILAGGMHGGYEWNTILLAYELLDYLQANPDFIPPSLTVYLIPNANPDGLYAVTEKTERFSAADVHSDTIPGRFNGRNVDLNRNWDCNWSPTALWRDNEISGGSAPFSEPENLALRDFILPIRPSAVLFWHSAATGVYSAGCGQVDTASKNLAQIYATASGYPLYDSFHHYDITGDASDWLAMQSIPSFTVELRTHEQLDWDMNLAGLRALFQHLAANG
jgi:predicted deacylase